MFACENGAADVVQMLLQRGAQVWPHPCATQPDAGVQYDAKDTGGRTAMTYARLNNHQPCMELLPADAVPTTPVVNNFSSFEASVAATPERV